MELGLIPSLAPYRYFGGNTDGKVELSGCGGLVPDFETIVQARI
jgi:hypothetical protein